MTQLATVASHFHDEAAAFCADSSVPGYLAGVYHRGDQVVVSHGVANLATSAPMREDTGFLFGSITKVLTTTLVLRQVERGLIDLDGPVTTYLPEFRLTTPGAAENMRVRNLLNHTNGIDADLFFLDASGRDALKMFVDELGQHCGALFAPGEFLGYSNGGMIVAGRLLEVVTGTPYHDLLASEVYANADMANSCTSAADAILRSTAVGHFPDLATGGARPTGMFMLPESWAPAGATPIGTIGDLLAFARTHLAGGVSPSGKRLLSGESATSMRSVQHDLGTPNVPPVGFGWLLMPYGDTTVVTMSGASPGGVAILALVPEHDLAFACYANDMRGIALHDRLLLWLLREHLGVPVPDLITEPTPVADLTPYVGTYRSNQLRVDVSVVDGQLEERMTYEPFDEAQRRVFAGFAGGMTEAPPQRYVPIGKDLFAPAGMPLSAFTGYSRQLLISYHDARLRCAGGRMSRKVTG